MTTFDLKRDGQDGAVRLIYQDFRVALVGTVQTFQRATSRVVVELMTRFQGFDGKPHVEPTAQDVPVMHTGGDGYGLWHDMAPGDPGVVLCCDGPVRGYFETGQPVTPQNAASHSYGCAVMLPGGRVSNTTTPTAPPNAPGTGQCGSGNGSACIVYRRAGHPHLPGELGSVVIKAAGPVASVKLGGDDATLGVARLGDPVAATTALTTVLSAIVAVVNGIAPGSVTPPQLAAALAHLGDISGASVQVVSK